MLGAAAVLLLIAALVLILGNRGSGPGSLGALGPSSSPGGASTGPPPSSAGATAEPAAPACTQADLKIAASTSQPSYAIGESPGLNLVVTDIGSAPCVADLSDSNIVLLVYSGDARVWGSHDCSVQPGSSPETLPVNDPVTRQIVWAGMSSSQGCTAPRQRVGAGSYTLQPVFAGQAGSSVTFTIAGP
jgi:hypothetical protein